MRIRDIGLFIIGAGLLPAPLARLSGLAMPVPVELLIVCDAGAVVACLACVLCSFKDPS